MKYIGELIFGIEAGFWFSGLFITENIVKNGWTNYVTSTIIILVLATVLYYFGYKREKRERENFYKRFGMIK